jgi:uncharacterized protein
LAVREHASAKQKTRLTVYDTDLHHGWNSKSEFLPFLAPEYRDRFMRYGIDAQEVDIASNGGVRGVRADMLVEGLAPTIGGAAADALATRDHLLDGSGIDWALLTGGPAAGLFFHRDIDYANALARAFNHFTIEHWLAVDDRYRFALSVNFRDPQAAVAEIERFGDHPAVVGIMLLAGSTIPFGQRFFDPIHRACVERDLVWTIHFDSEGKGVNPPPSAAGYPTYFAEKRVNRAASYKAHIASFIFEGVFDRYPSLKIAILEAGFGWVPPFLWSMDQVWSDLRHQHPNLRRRPSDYVFDHVRFASQPEEEPAPADGLEKDARMDARVAHAHVRHRLSTLGLGRPDADIHGRPRSATPADLLR